MTLRIIRAALVLSGAAAWAQELHVDVDGSGGGFTAAAVELRLADVRLIARTHRGVGRSVVGIDAAPLTAGPLRLTGLARVPMISPLGLLPWSTSLAAAGGPRLDAARAPSGRFGAALRAPGGYAYVMRRSGDVRRFGAGARIGRGAALTAELAAVLTRLPDEPAGAAAEPPPRQRMLHAAARLRGAGDLLQVTAVPIVMAADRLPPSGAGVVGVGLAAGWLRLDGSLAFAGRRYFTGDAKRAAGAAAAVRARAADGAGQSLELRAHWRAGASPERVLTARLAAGAPAAGGFAGRAGISHRQTRSSYRVGLSGRLEARAGGHLGWLSGAVSTNGERTTSRIELGARVQAAPQLLLTAAAGWAGEWTARVACVLRPSRHEVAVDLDHDADWGIGFKLRR